MTPEEMIDRSAYFIMNITEPSEKIQLAAVNKIPYAIAYIKNPSLEVQLAAINGDEGVVYWISDLYDEAAKLALSKDVMLIKNIKASLAIQIFALELSIEIVDILELHRYPELLNKAIRDIKGQANQVRTYE